MADLRSSLPDSPEQKAKVRSLASKQFGVVARRQLLYLGIPSSVIGDWCAGGELHALHRGVYAVGHTALAPEGWLTAAVLYAGPGAMLSDTTAAWWLSLTDRHSSVVHVSTPRKCSSLPGIEVHARRPWTPRWHRGVPVAPLGEVLLGYADVAKADEIRYALAQAEYRGWLDVETIRSHLGRGRPGSAALRQALRAHEPRLAMTRSLLERELLTLCERFRIALPEVNVVVEGHRVDALWPVERVIVEVDGSDSHRSWRQIARDHERDLRLRRAGYVVLRYTWAQVVEQPADVAADLRRALSDRRMGRAR